MWSRYKPKEQKTVHLFGDFRKSQVNIGNGGLLGRKKALDSEVFEQPFHDEFYKGTRYRFVNPEKAYGTVSVDTFKKDKNSYVFEGDLDSLFLEVTNDGVRAQYIEEPKEVFPYTKPEEPKSPG